MLMLNNSRNTHSTEHKVATGKEKLPKNQQLQLSFYRNAMESNRDGYGAAAGRRLMSATPAHTHTLQIRKQNQIV